MKRDAVPVVRHSGDEVRLDDRKYTFVREDDIPGVVA